MSVISMHFSPTGGTESVLNILAGELGAKVCIDLTQNERDYGIYRFEKCDLCLIGVPSYGGRVPKTAADRLSRMKADGALAVIVAVYGNRAYDDTLTELKNIAEGCGFRVIAAIGAVAEHSVARKFGRSRPDADDENDLRKFAGNIKEKISKYQNAGELKLPGQEPYRAYTNLPLLPKANGNCNKCGLCAAKCPVGAISKSNPVDTDKGVCIACMRCVSVCPKKARSIGKIMELGAGLMLQKSCGVRKENEIFI